MPTPMNELPTAIRAILSPPTIAGEDPAMAAEIFALVEQDWGPGSFREWTLVSQVANAETEILRLGPVRKWAINAAVARTILKQILDTRVETDDAGFRAQYQPPVEQQYSQSWCRQMKRLSFAAVSGDSDAVQIIEGKIGANKIGVGAETVEEFERTMASQVFLDRSLSAAVSRRDSACRELESLALRRSKRAAETCQRHGRGPNEVPLASADASVGPPPSASVPVAESLNTPAQDWVSVRAPRAAPSDEPTAQEGSDDTTGEQGSDESAAQEGSDEITAQQGSDEPARS